MVLQGSGKLTSTDLCILFQAKMSVKIYNIHHDPNIYLISNVILT